MHLSRSRNVDDLLRDGTVGLDNDLVHLLGGCNRVGLVVEPLELFQGTSLGLDAEKVPDDGLDEIPADKDVDDILGNVLEADGQGELVDEADRTDNDARCSETLGSHSSLQSLGGNNTLEGSVGEGVDDLEHEIGRKGSLANPNVDGLPLTSEDGG